MNTALHTLQGLTLASCVAEIEYESDETRKGQISLYSAFYRWIFLDSIFSFVNQPHNALRLSTRLQIGSMSILPILLTPFVTNKISHPFFRKSLVLLTNHANNLFLLASIVHSFVLIQSGCVAFGLSSLIILSTHIALKARKEFECKQFKDTLNRIDLHFRNTIFFLDVTSGWFFCDFVTKIFILFNLVSIISKKIFSKTEDTSSHPIRSVPLESLTRIIDQNPEVEWDTSHFAEKALPSMSSDVNLDDLSTLFTDEQLQSNLTEIQREMDEDDHVKNLETKPEPVQHLKDQIKKVISKAKLKPNEHITILYLKNIIKSIQENKVPPQKGIAALIHLAIPAGDYCTIKLNETAWRAFAEISLHSDRDLRLKFLTHLQKDRKERFEYMIGQITTYMNNIHFRNQFFLTYGKKLGMPENISKDDHLAKDFFIIHMFYRFVFGNLDDIFLNGGHFGPFRIFALEKDHLQTRPYSDNYSIDVIERCILEGNITKKEIFEWWRDNWVPNNLSSAQQTSWNNYFLAYSLLTDEEIAYFKNKNPNFPFCEEATFDQLVEDLKKLIGTTPHDKFERETLLQPNIHAIPRVTELVVILERIADLKLPEELKIFIRHSPTSRVMIKAMLIAMGGIIRETKQEEET